MDLFPEFNINKYKDYDKKGMYKIGKFCTENTHSDTLASPIGPPVHPSGGIWCASIQYNKHNKQNKITI